MSPKSKQRPGTERARDEQREDVGPAYGGELWNVADERGDRRFGHARNDDANPLELLKEGQGRNDDDESPIAADDELAAAEGDSSIESGGQRAGMGRGDRPRKPKVREKPNPKSGSKVKTKRA